MLADYRAKGGRIRQKEASDPFGSAGPAAAASGGSQNRAPDVPVKALGKADSEEEKTGKQNDVNWTTKVQFMDKKTLVPLTSLKS